jgi:hypothetical protein
VHDIEGQLARLIGKRFVVDTPFERLQQYPRYLNAIAVRLDKLKTGGAHGAARDARLLAEEYLPLWTALSTARHRAGQAGGQRRAARAVPLVARGIARAPLRAGTTHTGAGVEQAAAENVGGHPVIAKTMIRSEEMESVLSD